MNPRVDHVRRDDVRVEAALLSAMEKRQSQGAAGTAVLSLLILFTVNRADARDATLLWVVLVFAAAFYKTALSFQGRFKRFAKASNDVKSARLDASAALTGLLWSAPIWFMDVNNSIELAAAAIIVSGVISGSVSIYLGRLRSILFVATPPCASIMLALGRFITPTPSTVILSILIFYAFILTVSLRTEHNVRSLFRMRFENLALIENLEASHKKLLTLSNIDDLTGLPNRRLLSELFGKFVADAKRMRKKIAVFFIDMDKFKPINDRYGHETGDKVLIEAGRIMTAALRAGDVVARLGGDEFVAVVKGIDALDDARVVADKLRAAMRTTIDVNGLAIPISAGVGAAVHPDDGADLDALLKIADAAMYSDKRCGDA